MKKILEPGKYIVAVSGGVDSVVLLDMLAADPKLELVVAHFDHGIREESAEDAAFVGQLAEQYGLPFVSKRVELGGDASEALAREARYWFLRQTCAQQKCDAIVTAHHQDDLIETALLNTLRGTKRRGLVSLKSTDEIKRPLLDYSKQELLEYARKHNLQWREDSSNAQQHYLRNRYRPIIKNSLNQKNRLDVVTMLKEIEKQNMAIEKLVHEYLIRQPQSALPRRHIARMQLAEAYEIIAGWLRQNNISFDTATLNRITRGVKTLRTGAQIDVQQNYYCELTKDQIVLHTR